MKVDPLVLREPVAGVGGGHQHVDIMLEMGPAAGETVVAPFNAVEDAVAVHEVGLSEQVTGDLKGQLGDALGRETVGVLRVELWVAAQVQEGTFPLFPLKLKSGFTQVSLQLTTVAL